MFHSKVVSDFHALTSSEKGATVVHVHVKQLKSAQLQIKVYLS